LITLAEQDEAIGQVWHIPTAEPITGREFVRLIFEAVGRVPKVTAYSSQVVKALGLLWSLAREGAEMIYQFEQPFIIDSSKYQSAFGEATATSYQARIRQTIDWYRAQGQSGSNKPHQSDQRKTNWVNADTLKPLLPSQQRQVSE
jgi:nucleoside-diphosphate-sugar epimerase